MIDLGKFSSYKISIKEASKDTSSNETIYMSNSDYKVYNFDAIKKDFIKKLDLNINDILHSNDCIFKKDDKLFFIEFKNGNIINQKEKQKIYKKIFDSIIILLSLYPEQSTKKFKEYLNYILVYNENKNTLYDNFGQNLNKDAKNEKKYIINLEPFKNLYFNTAESKSIKDFENFINSKK